MVGCFLAKPYILSVDFQMNIQWLFQVSTNICIFGITDFNNNNDGGV